MVGPHRVPRPDRAPLPPRVMLIAPLPRFGGVGDLRYVISEALIVDQICLSCNLAKLRRFEVFPAVFCRELCCFRIIGRLRCLGFVLEVVQGDFWHYTLYFELLMDGQFVEDLRAIRVHEIDDGVNTL